jgi:hypothetical protein
MGKGQIEGSDRSCGDVALNRLLEKVLKSKMARDRSRSRGTHGLVPDRQP